jgi:NhaP-type Na+/H+ or K+/H+ antiporter
VIELEGTTVLFVAAGVATLLAAILPKLLGRLPVSAPMVFLGAGALVWLVVPGLPSPDPAQNEGAALHLTEVCVIVSLMGAGLALNRPVGLRSWSSTWRLLGITMPLSMLAVGLLGWWALGLGAASALLLAAALAPTDPVLATEVQVSEPVTSDDADDDEVRFALTSEAGLNDGLAFPFTWAAVAMSMAGAAPSAWLPHWLAVDVVWRLTCGIGVGLLVGWLLGRLFFSSIAERLRLADRTGGFVALAATFLAYGVAELAEGYGFIAVFVCACTLRSAERSHRYHQVLHTFVEQVERLLTVVVVVLLGAAVARGLLSVLGWREWLVAVAVILVVRPAAGWIGLTPGKTGPRERAVISFFGVRGVGSLFYVAFALTYGAFPDAERLWGMTGLVVVLSIVVHGITSTPTMAIVDALRRREARRQGQEVETTPV